MNNLPRLQATCLGFRLSTVCSEPILCQGPLAVTGAASGAYWQLAGKGEHCYHGLWSVGSGYPPTPSSLEHGGVTLPVNVPAVSWACTG